MRPGILYELSRRLAALLERGIQGGDEDPPVTIFLGHPLDVVEERVDPEDERATGVLYLYRLRPDARFRQAGVALEVDPTPGGTGRLAHAAFWVRARYAFLLVGGTLEDELGALAAVLELLDRHSLLSVRELEPARAAGDEGVDAKSPFAAEALPVEIVDEPLVWRELGLQEHQLVVSFDVSVPLAPGRSEEVRRILERDVRVELNEFEREAR